MTAQAGEVVSAVAQKLNIGEEEVILRGVEWFVENELRMVDAKNHRNWRAI